MAVATPAPVQPEATPEPNYFTPEGIFYTVVKASIETDSGIIGIKPGTKVKLVAPGEYETGGQRVKLTDDQVTNDLRIAQRVLAADAAGQAALRREMATWRQAEPPAAPAAAAPPVSRIYVYGRPAPTPAPTGLNRGAYGEKKAFNKDFDIVGPRVDNPPR